MADYSSLSDSELLALAEQQGLLTQESSLDALIRGAQDAPSQLVNMPRGIYELGANTLEMLSGQQSKEEAQRTLQSLGGLGAGTAGGVASYPVGAAIGGTIGLAGGPLAPFTVPAGAFAGGAISSALGSSIASRGYEYLTDLIMGKEAPTETEARNNLAYDLGSGVTTDLLTFGLGRAGRGALSFLDDAADVYKMRKGGPGREIKAGKALEKLGIDKQMLSKMSPDDIRTLGEQLQDPSIARVEAALGRQYGQTAGDLAADLVARRAQARQELLGTEAPNITKPEAGAAIKQSLESALESKKGDVSAAYKAIPTDTVLDVSPIRNRIAEILDSRLTEGRIEYTKIDPTVQRITLDLIENADAMSLEKLQGLRETLGDFAGPDAPSGINKTLARDIRKAIDASEAEIGGKLKEAVTQRREQGAQFEEGAVGRILKRRGFGEQVTPDSLVVSAALKSPEAAQQVSAALDDVGRQAISDFVLNDIRAKVASGKFGAAINYYKNKSLELETLLNPEQFDSLSKAIGDIESQLQYEALIKQPSRASSPTAQFTADQQGLARLMGTETGFIEKHPILTKGGGMLLGAAAGPSVFSFGGNIFGTVIGGKIAEKAVSYLADAEPEIAGLLYKALSDKNTALDLLDKAAKGDSYAAIAIKKIDGAVELAADSLGIKPEQLRGSLAPTMAQVGKIGSEAVQERDRTRRVEEYANIYSEMDDATLLKLAREQGLLADDSKKKDSGVKKVKSDIEKLVNTAAEEAGIAPELLKALVMQESGGNPDAVGYETPETKRQGARAQGLGQLMPATAKEQAALMGIEKPDLSDPETNLKLSAGYLKRMLDRFGDVELALTAYHSGPGTVANLLKYTGGNSLSDIIDDLGPAGKAYARSVLKRV